MSGRNLYLVAYDIADAKRLRKVFKSMHGYGDPLQYSVFACELNAKERAIMLARLDSLIHHQEDRIMVADLGPAEGRSRAAITFLGKVTPPPSRGPVIV